MKISEVTWFAISLFIALNAINYLFLYFIVFYGSMSNAGYAYAYVIYLYIWILITIYVSGLTLLIYLYVKGKIINKELMIYLLLLILTILSNIFLVPKLVLCTL